MQDEERLLEEHRISVLTALMDAVDHGAEVMQLAQSSTNEDDFAAKLSQRFGFTAVQSRAVADMPISRYCPLWRNRLEREVQQLREDLESS